MSLTLAEAIEATQNWSCSTCEDSRGYTCLSCRQLRQLRAELPALYAAKQRLPRLQEAYKGLRVCLGLPV